MPRIRVFDTTLRDGEQTPGAALTVDEKVTIAKQLARLRVDVIEAGFPAASPGEAEAVRRISAEVGAADDAPAIAALARCVPADVTVAAAALDPARKRQLHVFIATSDIHITHKLRTTREDVLERIRTCVAQARRMVGPDHDVEFSAEDASRSELPFLLEAYEAAVAGWCIGHQRARHRRLHGAEGIRGGREAGCQGRRATRDREHPLPQRPGHRHRQHARRHPGRCTPGRGHRQRPRRARRQRLARRGGHGAPHAADPVPIGHDRGGDRAAHRYQPPGELPHRHPGPAEQERGRRQRLRPRVGHPPGRIPEEPADLRDHDPGVGRPVRLDADARQALRSRGVRRAPATAGHPRRARDARPALRRSHQPGGPEEAGDRCGPARARRDARRSRSAARPARALGGRQSPGRVELAATSHSSTRARPSAPSPAATGRSTRSSRRSTTRSSRSSPGGRSWSTISSVRSAPGRTPRARPPSRSPRRPARGTCRRSSPDTGYPPTWSRRRYAPIWRPSTSCIAEHPIAADAIEAARQRRSGGEPVPTPAGSHP